MLNTSAIQAAEKFLRAGHGNEPQKQVGNDVVPMPQDEYEAFVKMQAEQYVEGVFRRVRGERDAELVRSDWTQTNDAPLTDANKKAWAKYRQQLRDLPESITDPTQPVTWPTPPK